MILSWMGIIWGGIGLSRKRLRAGIGRGFGGRLRLNGRRDFWSLERRGLIMGLSRMGGWRY